MRLLIILAAMLGSLALASPASALTTSPSPSPSSSCTTAPGTTVQCHPSRIPLPAPSKLPTLSQSTSAALHAAKPARHSLGAPTSVAHEVPARALASTGPRWRPAAILGGFLVLIGGMAMVAGRGRVIQ